MESLLTGLMSNAVLVCPLALAASHRSLAEGSEKQHSPAAEANSGMTDRNLTRSSHF